MRRRRLLRRAIRGTLPLQPLGLPARRLLRRAHQLQAAGQHLDAAQLFEQLAEGARVRELPQYPQLLLQAGRAFILAGEKERGSADLMKAFQVLADRGQGEALRRIAPRIHQFLARNQLDDVWQSIQNMLEAHQLDIDSSWSEKPGPAPLPSKCPYCGGTLNPSEVERTPGGGAVCMYCGSIVQGDA
ncbi:MAG: TFIIB-type zinc ribbon-containing protein [Anaerolineales bacterium]